MRKAGAKEGFEGSIGSDVAVDVNRSPVSAAARERRPDLMIRLCTCTGRSSLHNLNNSGITLTCKGCGGESTADRGGPSCSSKLNTMGLDLPRPIDPGVRWKTVNRRQRAARRARTSFSGEDRMKDEIRSFYACGSAASQEMVPEDAPVSESEKLGVSILGRRFSDTMENVPIKKRRFLMDCSPSPPPTPLLVDPYERLLSRSCGGTSYGKHRKAKMLGDEYMKEKKGPVDAADFSGISILAAAALDSEMDDDLLNVECSKSAHSLDERKPKNIIGSSELNLLNETKEDMINILDASQPKNILDASRSKNILDTSHCKSQRPLESTESAFDMKPLFSTTMNSEDLVGSTPASRDNYALHSALSSANKTDDSSSASDAKSSGVTMLNNSSNPDKSVGCLQDTVAEAKRSSGTRDSRFHWDLNVAMEAWDTNCGDDDHDLVGPDPVASAISKCNDAENEMNKPHVSQDIFDSTVAGDIPDLSGDKIRVVDEPKDAQTKGGSGFPGDSSSQPLCSPSKNLQLVESKPLDGCDSSAGTKDLPDHSYVSKVELHLQPDPDCSCLATTTECFALTANVEKLDVSHASTLDCVGLSQLASADGHGINSVMSDLGSRVKPLASRLVSEESTNLATVTVFNKSVTELGWINNACGQASQQSISEFKNQELLDDSGTSQIDQSVNNKVEHDIDVLGRASQQSISEFKNQELLDVDSGTSRIDQSVNNKVGHDIDVSSITKRAADAHSDLDLSDPHPNKKPGSSDCDMAHVHEGDVTDATINNNHFLITCANSSNTETYHITNDARQAPGINSECTKPAINDMDIIVDSQSAAQSYPNGYNNELGKVVSTNFLEHCYKTDASHMSKDLAVTGKVDVEEDDSQYEDGELRESGDYWPYDGYEEVKHANYQLLDDKDAEGAPDVSSLPVGSMSKNVDVPVANYNGTQSRKEDTDASSFSLKRSWSTNCLDDGSGILCAGSDAEKASSVHLRVKGEARMYEMNPCHVIAGSVATVSQSVRRGIDGLGDDLSNLRTKSTGWDLPPEDQRHFLYDSTDRADPSNRCVLSTSDAAGGGESLRHRELSNGDEQSRVDRSRSFDRPHRNELCRSDDGYGSGSKAERTIDAHKSHEMNGVSRHIQGSSRGEQWVDHSRSARRRSPDYYNYGPPGPRNAAEAAVAKMESNGFVVARDGTLVKAADAANAGKMARRVANTSSSSHRPLSGRGSPVDKDGGCGVSRSSAHVGETSSEQRFGANGNRSVRYGPEMDKDHTNVNMSSVRCSLSTRQRRFPPHRASLNPPRAHSRSPSGSRSRSPHAWTSPRNRREIMANGSSSLRRHSRSPSSYMTEVRMGRMTSPSRRPGFDDRVMGYSPSSRNHAYSQHASKWNDGRNCPVVNVADNKKLYSRRSPPLRVTSRNDRFDVMDSQGRPRSGELCRSTQGRLPYGFERGKGNKHDGPGDDQRAYANRYETHSVKPYDRNGTEKQFRNHTGDKLRPRISVPRSPEPQRRGSPRRFDRGFERQLGVDLPRGPKEDSKKPFRYD